MRLTTTCKGLLFGGAFALLAAGCKDDTTTASDSGVDAGPRDSGPMDSGQDAGPSLPVYLRLAHFAFGSDVGPVHICARDPSDNSRLLLTTDALATGNFRAPNLAIPFPYGSVTRHLVLDAEVLSQVAGKTIEIYRASEAGTAISGNPGDSLRFATCTPTAPALDSATVGIPGSGADVILVPGQAATMVIAGSDGPEIAADPTCAGVGGATLCPGPHIMPLIDEVDPGTSSTDARLRTILLDGRKGPSLGLCHAAASAPSTFTPFTTAGTVAFGVASPAYEDVDPVMGNSAADPRIVTLHLNTLMTCGAAPAAPSNGIFPAGAFANALLINSYTAAAGAGQPVATIRPSLAVGEVTTMFIAPVITEFFAPADPTTPGVACNPSTYTPAGGCLPKGVDTNASLAACVIGSSATCVPGGTNPAMSDAPCVIGNPATPACTPCDPTNANGSCLWITTTFPAADALPASP